MQKRISVMKATLKSLLADAGKDVRTYEVTDAMERVKQPDVLFVDVRDSNELVAEGKIPGAIHASRGLLEFYIDPESPYHKKELSNGSREIVFYCKSGGRSALAAQRAREMGLENIAHVGGGFIAWKEKGGPVEGVTQ